MANEPEEERPADEGGPVKSFLEHLEDLRWVLIKSAATIGIVMVLCLIAGDRLVKVLKWPLERATAQYKKDEYVAVVMFGDTRLGTYKLDTNQQAALQLGSNRFVAVRVTLDSPTNTPGISVTNPPAGAPTNAAGAAVTNRPVAQMLAAGSNNLELHLSLDTSPAAERLARKLVVDLNTMSPAGGFFVAFQVAFYGGLAVSSPLLLFYIAQFVFPALKARERRYVYRGLWYSVPLFLCGVSFCYFVLMPVALSASSIYSNWLGLSASIWNADEYVSFVSKFMLGMGLGFEMPVVILVLVKIGILNYSILSKARRYMIVINLILGALLTTPEVLTQILMAVPLQLLFEISVWIAWYWEWKEKRRAAAAGEVEES